MLTSRTRRLESRTICKKRGECWCAIGLSEGQLIRSTVTAGHSNGQITSGRVATNMGASDYCPRSFPHSAHQEWVFRSILLSWKYSQDCPFLRPDHCGGCPSIGQTFLRRSHPAMTRKINTSKSRMALVHDLGSPLRPRA